MGLPVLPPIILRAKTGDMAIADKILLASPDAGQAEKKSLFREAGGVNIRGSLGSVGKWVVRAVVQ